MWTSIRRLMGSGAAEPAPARGAGRPHHEASLVVRVSGMPNDKPVAVEDLVKGAAAAATAVWKLSSRVEREKREHGFEPPKWLQRQLEAAQDALHAAGIEAKDHTGDKYVPGMAMTVIAFQPAAGITFDVISETLKPTVYFKDALIQAGEVLVSTPSADGAEGASSSSGNVNAG